MGIDNYTTQKMLREIMYSALGYHKNNESWHKTKLSDKKHLKGHIQCSKCLEYFEKEFIIRRNKNNYCTECEKTITKAHII